MVRETGCGNLIIRYSSYRPPKHSTFYEERKKTSKTSGFYAYTALHRFYLNPAPPPPYHISFNTLYAGHTFSIICLEPHTSAVAGPALLFYILNKIKLCTWRSVARGYIHGYLHTHIIVLSRPPSRNRRTFPEKRARLCCWWARRTSNGMHSNCDGWDLC